MSIKIKCPYCFKVFNDDQVHFRSENITTNMNKIEIKKILKDFDNIDAFEQFYEGEDKVQIRDKYNSLTFYNPVNDERYQKFWDKFGGETTEIDAEKDENKKGFRRKIIDPRDELHQRHLQRQADGSYLIRDPQKRNMVSSVQTIDGDEKQTSKRVCPYCHNPLPDGYGLYDVKFISVIGVVGSGKTVFLYQFLDEFDTYVAECGLTAIRRSQGIQPFLDANAVDIDKELPGPTKEGRFEQPLIYNIEKNIANSNKKETITIVMYDIAGENFKNAKSENIDNVAPFIKESDGIILLVDPIQFDKLSDGLNDNSKDKQKPADALTNIHHVLMGADEKYKKPVAICVSKMDSITDYLPSEIIQYVQSDYHGESIAGKRTRKQLFNARERSIFNQYMADFICTYDLPIINALDTGYANYNFFGFTALNCNVIDNKPIGPIQPHRIEDPILWMLCQIGFIGTNDIECPYCHEFNASFFRRVFEERIEYRPEKRLFRVVDVEHRISVPINCMCNECGCRFYNADYDFDNL